MHMYKLPNMIAQYGALIRIILSFAAQVLFVMPV